MWRHALLRWLTWIGLGLVLLQLFFLLRIALMAKLAPESTTFERSQAWSIATQKNRLPWRQEWVPYARISDHLKRAVIASEDDIFAQHDGVQWDAIEKAWAKNAQAELQASRRGQKKPAKIVGGSTITQQLAKNLFLSGERTFVRKGQEFVLTLMLETFLTKPRILELYLNHVEWGEGVFGAEAAARHYFGKSAAQLTPWEAARLAVMLPRPKHYEKFPQSEYLSGRSEIILGRMGGARNCPETTMRILGIDPGLRTTGFGVIEHLQGQMRYIASGTIQTLPEGRASTAAAKGDLPARLKILFDGIREVTARYQPTCAAVEIVFINVNPQASLLLGQARGACLTALVSCDLPVAEYTALQMKQAVAGHGKAQKAQVQEMVKRMLNLPGLPGPDAADALGLAITHATAGLTLSRLADQASLARKASGMYRGGRTR